MRSGSQADEKSQFPARCKERRHRHQLAKYLCLEPQCQLNRLCCGHCLLEKHYTHKNIEVCEMDEYYDQQVRFFSQLISERLSDFQEAEECKLQRQLGQLFERLEEQFRQKMQQLKNSALSQIRQFKTKLQKTDKEFVQFRQPIFSRPQRGLSAKAHFVAKEMAEQAQNYSRKAQQMHKKCNDLLDWLTSEFNKQARELLVFIDRGCQKLLSWNAYALPFSFTPNGSGKQNLTTPPRKKTKCPLSTTTALLTNKMLIQQSKRRNSISWSKSSVKNHLLTQNAFCN